MSKLSGTFRVHVDGTVERGVTVPRLLDRDGNPRYMLAGPPIRAHGRRFMPNTMPEGVNVNSTIPHDCENHIREFESQRDSDARTGMLSATVAA